MSDSVLAVVKDLFFTARIRETGRLAGVPVEICPSGEHLKSRAESGALADFVIVDLTTRDWDYEALFGLLEGRSPRPQILGFTTHALARSTQPWHARCDRVVTKETLTRELPDLLMRRSPGRRAS